MRLGLVAIAQVSRAAVSCCAWIAFGHACTNGECAGRFGYYSLSLTDMASHTSHWLGHVSKLTHKANWT